MKLNEGIKFLKMISFFCFDLFEEDGFLTEYQISIINLNCVFFSRRKLFELYTNTIF